MLRTTLASSRVLRVGVLGLVTITAAIVFTTDSADARRYRHRTSHATPRGARELQPAIRLHHRRRQFRRGAEIHNPDGSRHPASLTKIMTLYLLFERLDAGRLCSDTSISVS